MREALPEGSKVMAVIMSVNIERQLVDLSIKPSYLASNESWWVRKRHENHHCRRWFEEGEAWARGENFHGLATRTPP